VSYLNVKLYGLDSYVTSEKVTGVFQTREKP